MNKKPKKELIKQVADEVVNDYDYSQALDLPIEQLTGVEEQTPPRGLRTLPEVAEYIDNFYSDSLIVPEGYSAQHRDIQPYQYFGWNF